MTTTPTLFPAPRPTLLPAPRRIPSPALRPATSKPRHIDVGVTGVDAAQRVPLVL